MKRKKHKIKRAMTKMGFLLLVCMGSISQSCSQEKSAKTDSVLNDSIILKANAESDWKHLDYMKNFFCIPEECDSLENSSFLVYLKYKDKLYTKRSELAEAFLDAYPNDPHYDKALSLFLSTYFRPIFINEKMTKSQNKLLSKHPAKSPKKITHWAYRRLPIDIQAKKRWLQKGNDYVAQILASNTSLERKAKVAIWLFNRDYNQARYLHKYLPKNDMESDYWMAFESQYWELFRIRLNGLLDEYPESERLARYVKAVLDDIHRYAPPLSMAYSEAFLTKLKDGGALGKGHKLLYKTLKANLDALNNLEGEPAEAPLEMEFTAMRGKKVNLTDLRGKVVLIDFWSTYCPPCIADMPHLKALYDKYKNQGFEIIGIADNGDGSKGRILKILKRAGADWPQRLDKGKDATVSFHSLYNIKVLPTLWLLDTNGSVVEKNIKRDDLEPLIRKYLNLKTTKNH
ncbi:TlpA family protein disulfide reductase [Hwangdonia sp.]|uniref:TlpA family protein disulfide reductase n=1 Tax=Hwangdonia sp. TaxID=1883432 RepID=UPI003AB4D508